MALLGNHLEQISLSSKSIGQLEFPVSKIFTNALIRDHEITTLIRDTEPHERALFSIDPSVVNSSSRVSAIRKAGDDNTFQKRKSIFPNAQPVKQSIITRLLGNEMLQEIRQSTSNTTRSQDGVNVEVLLRGAEKLSEVYAVTGVTDKINSLRRRYRETASSVSVLEGKVAKQQSLLDRRNKGLDSDDLSSDPDVHDHTTPTGDINTFTLEDFQAEEEEIRELEIKKKALEDRVLGIERDLGGLR